MTVWRGSRILSCKGRIQMVQWYRTLNRKNPNNKDTNNKDTNNSNSNYRNSENKNFDKINRVAAKLLKAAGICAIMIVITACTEQNELSYQKLSETEEAEGLTSKQPWDEEMNEEELSEGQDKNSSIRQSRECYVYVCGEVNRPGVYTFPEGSRVFEVIDAAEGYTEYAAENHINQAEKIVDGMKLVVPSIEEAQQLEAEADRKKSKLVDINIADKDELMTLPGIGEGRAEAILAYREQNGGFKTPEDLLKVDGIKQGIYDKLKAFIIVT